MSRRHVRRVTPKSTLKLSLVSRTIVVTDADGKPGGNVLTDSGRKLVFRNRTGRACTLTFRMLLPHDVVGSDPQVWPFSSPRPSSATNPVLRIAAGGTATCTLVDFGSGLAIKYEVVAAGSPRVPTLDPMIVVRPVLS